MKQQSHKEKILKEFDKEYDGLWAFIEMEYGSRTGTTPKIKIKDFISQAIDETEKRWKEKRIEIGIKHAREISECEKRVRKETLEKVREEIKEVVDFGYEAETIIEQMQVKYLDEVIKSIKK